MKSDSFAQTVVPAVPRGEQLNELANVKEKYQIQ